MTRLQQHYDTVVRPAMQERFEYANPMRIPKLEKIIINMGMGEAVKDSKVLWQLKGRVLVGNSKEERIVF